LFLRDLIIYMALVGSTEEGNQRSTRIERIVGPPRRRHDDPLPSLPSAAAGTVPREGAVRVPMGRVAGVGTHDSDPCRPHEHEVI
jgi:hypothetical protein